jgi:CTP:molybdopterin cytidylyltransferase MocA
MATVAAAVLAAGAGRRMGAPKADLVVDGRRLLDRAVRTALAAGCAPVLAVVRGGTAVDGAGAVVNPAPERGLRSSLALAVDAIEPVDGAPAVDALAVLLVDVPGIGPDAVARVCAAWSPGRIAVGRYAGGRAHPTVMSPALWREALRLAGPDEGARALLAARPELVDEVAVPGDPADLDTPVDLARWADRPGPAHRPREG